MKSKKDSKLIFIVLGDTSVRGKRGRDGNGLKVTLTKNDGFKYFLAQLRLSALVTGVQGDRENFTPLYHIWHNTDPTIAKKTHTLPIVTSLAIEEESS